MSTDHPPNHAPTSTTRTTKPSSQEEYAQVLHNLSWGLVIACPIIIVLPPRKLDFFTFSLAGGAVYGASILLRQRDGRGILDGLQRQNTSVVASQALPSEPAREMQEKLREIKQQGNLREERLGMEREKEKGVMAEVRRKEEEKPAWERERKVREKEALEEGRGYGDMIMDQIREVWNWGTDKAEEVEEMDRRVVEEENKEEKR